MKVAENKLSDAFFLKDTITVARALLGKKLIHILPNGLRVGGTIVETEAYLGAEDPACHTFGGRKTPRTKTMFARGGVAYVYFIYGMYHCLNAVTRDADEGEAVLIRALMPTEGIEFMQKQRPHVQRMNHLANGPGKLCRAMSIDRSCNGLSFMANQLYLLDAQPIADHDIEDSPRIGVDYAGDAAEWPLRYVIRNHPALSRVP